MFNRSHSIAKTTPVKSSSSYSNINNRKNSQEDMRNDDHEYVQEVDDDEDDLDLDNDDRYDFLKDKHDSDKSLAVSYTHLTLPTICSV